MAERDNAVGGKLRCQPTHSTGGEPGMGSVVAQQDSSEEYESAGESSSDAAEREPSHQTPLRSGSTSSNPALHLNRPTVQEGSPSQRPVPPRLTLPLDLEATVDVRPQVYVPKHPGLPAVPSTLSSPQELAQQAAKEGKLPRRANLGVVTPPHNPSELLSGVCYDVKYLGSTFVFIDDPTASSHVWAQKSSEAIFAIKQPDEERQPEFAIVLKITSENLTLINCQSNVELASFHLCTVSYVTDTADLLVIMVNRYSGEASQQMGRSKISAHLLQTVQARTIALAIGQAFNVAYYEFLRNSGVEENALQEVEYASVLYAQQSPSSELTPLVEGQTKQVIIGKKKREKLGIMVVAAGVGCSIPTSVIAHLSKTGPALRSGQLNVGDYLLSVNGTSLVGMHVNKAIELIKSMRREQLVKLVVLPTSPVLEVSIFRPDSKFPLGFSVKEGVVCDLIRGSMADRSGVRVGHRIIQIGTHNTVGCSHEHIVHLLQTAVGQIHMKMMHLLIYDVMTGKTAPAHF